MPLVIQGTSYESLIRTEKELFTFIEEFLILAKAFLTCKPEDLPDSPENFISGAEAKVSSLKLTRQGLFAAADMANLDELISEATAALAKKVSLLECELEKIQGKPQTFSFSIPQTACPRPLEKSKQTMPEEMFENLEDKVSVHSFAPGDDPKQDQEVYEDRKMKKVDEWIVELKAEILKEARDMGSELTEQDLLDQL
jgi:hypothetical protein